MMIANVRGEFHVVRGGLSIPADDITSASIVAEIDTASIATRDPQRDAHLKSADFLDVENFPLITFRSSRIESDGGTLVIEGELTIHGVTRNVMLEVDSIPVPTQDPWGNLRLAGAATTKIHRKDFGLTWNAALETGGVLVGDEVAIELDLEFVKQKSEN
jgi:polyisoprenoid-binding protein YceI